MNVLVLSGTFDIGGQGIRLVRAFQNHAPDYTVRAMARDRPYHNFPIDLPFRKRSVEELYQTADVVHVRNDFALYDEMAAKYGPKPVVIHYHGTRLRGNPTLHIREQRKRNAIGLVSTLDLYLLAPDDLEWLPAPYDVDWLTEIRRKTA